MQSCRSATIITPLPAAASKSRSPPPFSSRSSRNIAYQGVPVGTIKRFIAGKGNADKTAVIAAVRARGFHPADDNEADALAILLWAIETHGGVR